MAGTYALLDASFPDDDAEHNFRREFDVDLTRYDVRNGDLPPVPEAHWGYDAGVITGSAASVYWNREWIDDLEDWVVAAEDAAATVPLLGVCFGHQLLADALGGRVRSMGEYELGYHMIHQDDSTPLFEALPEWFVAFTAHSDEVVELPPGATAHATNPFSLHAFSRGDVFGVQFHPEMDLDTAESLLVHRGVDGEVVHRMIEEVTTGAHNEAEETKAIFETFEGMVAERHS